MSEKQNINWNIKNMEMETKLHYFGTGLTCAGHYFWELKNERMIDRGLSFPKGDGIPMSKHKEWPFNPESMPESKINGDTEFFIIGEYSILAICGSCCDNRSGCKSVFFTDKNVTKKELKKIIFSVPIAKMIIDKMPFNINL